MRSALRWGGGRLLDLEERECWELAATREIGRVAWVDEGGPIVLPVNYAVGDGEIWVRTSPYSLLARECDGVAVAFEVDEVDEVTRSGWSVLVRGRARLVHDDSHRARPWPDVEPWPEGRKTQHLVVAPRSVSGRPLLAS